MAVPTRTGDNGGKRAGVRLVDHGNRGGTRLVGHACTSPHVVIAVAMPIGRATARTAPGKADWGENMKILLRTSIAVFSLGLGSAYAGDGDGSSATTLFTSIQNKQAVTARSVAAQTPTIAVQNGGTAAQGLDTRPQGQATWSFRVFSLP